MWLAPIAVIFLGWLRNAGRNAGFFGSGFGTAALVVAILFILGGLIWWTAVSLERTERERIDAEVAVRRGEGRLAAVLQQLPIGVGLMNREGELVLTNSLMKKFMGTRIPALDPVFRKRWRAWDEEGRPLEPSEWPGARALRGETTNPGLEMLYTTPERTEIWTRVSTVPFEDQTSEITGAIAVVQDIDEQKRAATAKWRLAAIVESSEDAIISKDLEGIITSWNSGAQRLFGYTADEVVGKSITILMPPDRLSEEPKILARIRAGDRIEHFETTRRSKDGQLLDISLTVSPVTDAQNRIIGVSKIARDITARKRAEGRLDLLVQVSDLISTIHDSGELTYAVSEAVGAHLHVRRCLFNEIDFERDLEIVHRDYCDGVESVAGTHKVSDFSNITSEEMRLGKTVVNHDSKLDPRTADNYDTMYKPGGERAYVAIPLMRENSWVGSLWASDNRPRQWTKEEVSLLQTVAERTWTAIEKLRIDSALRASEERLRLATEAAEMHAWEFDLQSDITKRSVNVEWLTGFALPDIWQAGAELVHCDDRERVQQVLGEALETNGEFEFEYCLVNPHTNEEVWVFTAGKLIPGSQQKPGRVVGVTQDITKRKQAEAERERLLQSVQESRDAAEKANQLKDEFLATLSHELRNPLNVILGYSELLLRTPEVGNSPQLRQMSEALRRNAKSQSQLINDLLDLSRLQRGKISLNQETLSLAAIVDNAVETVRAEAAAKDVAIAVKPLNKLLLVDGDRLRLQQIAWNLLNNAVKFTPSGGSVEVTLGSDEENAILMVSDTGQGIEPGFLPHVFEMFRQADSSNSRKHGGMGIGLALVQQLVRLHEGTVCAESEGFGQGSRFTVKLPLTRDKEASHASASPISIRGVARTDLLVVDDSPDTVAMLEQMFKIEGANVTTAMNGIDALAIAAERRFDVILSDISMPGMDGFEFLRRLRQIPGREDIPVIAITGFGRTEDVNRARSAGFFSHLTKPLDLEALAEIFKQLAESSSLSTSRSI